MKYRVWYVKYVSFDVEAENEDEAIDLADEKLDAYERRAGDFYYEFNEAEELGE